MTGKKQVKMRNSDQDKVTYPCRAPGNGVLIHPHWFPARNFLYAASSPAPYSAVFFVGT